MRMWLGKCSEKLLVGAKRLRALGDEFEARRRRGSSLLAISAVFFLQGGKMRKVTDSGDRIVQAECYWTVLSEYIPQ